MMLHWWQENWAPIKILLLNVPNVLNKIKVWTLEAIISKDVAIQ